MTLIYMVKRLRCDDYSASQPFALRTSTNESDQAQTLLANFWVVTSERANISKMINTLGVDF